MQWPRSCERRCRTRPLGSQSRDDPRLPVAVMSDLSTLTQSEALFEEACRANGIQYRRLPIADSHGVQRPDYKVKVLGCGAIVEVKEISSNESDKQWRKDLAAGKIVSSTNEPGVRLRPKIRTAADQLQRASKRGIPTVAAIFDAVSSLFYTDPYNVKVAMYGLDAIVFEVPKDPAISPRMSRWKSGGKITMNATQTTSVSAIAIIRTIPSQLGLVPALLVYHNHFARVPLDPVKLQPYVWAQYALGQADNGSTDWIEISRQPR